MAEQEGPRWDVSLKDKFVYLERISDKDERVFDDTLTPEEARKLGGLLTKYADQAGESEKSGDDERDGDERDEAKHSGDSDNSKDDADEG